MRSSNEDRATKTRLVISKIEANNKKQEARNTCIWTLNLASNSSVDKPKRKKEEKSGEH